ncbi:MAG: MerR family transcriptional regulator [Thermodesulfovibrionales bacterium]|jgi:hypothetical protein
MEDTLTAGAAAKRLGVTVKSLQRWEREGRLITAGRTATNRRVYGHEQIARFQGIAVKRRARGREDNRIVQSIFSGAEARLKEPASWVSRFLCSKRIGADGGY